jgi:fibro-slime domain-containing protein
MRWFLSCAVLAACLPMGVVGQESGPIFGTTVVVPSGLEGALYHIHHRAATLDDFKKMKPAGTIYTSSLNIPPQDFKQGFPGVTKRFEWFAINYTGRFWIDNPGTYTFDLLSDDGAWLYIDDQLVIDNGGLHPPQEKDGQVGLSGGIHRIRVAYFQGPKWQVALVLKVAGPGEQLRIFSTDEFRPPPNPELWRYPDTNRPGRGQKETEPGNAPVE